MENNYVEYSKSLKVNLTVKDIRALLIKEDVNLQLNSGRNLLIESVIIEDLDLVKYLINKNIDIDFKDKLGNTALIWAAIKGFDEIVKILLENKSDVNQQNYNGFTSLMWASINGHHKCVDCLLNADADISIQSKWGLTAADISIQSKWGLTAADISIQSKWGLTAADYAKYEIDNCDNVIIDWETGKEFKNIYKSKNKDIKYVLEKIKEKTKC